MHDSCASKTDRSGSLDTLNELSIALRAFSDRRKRSERCSTTAGITTWRAT